MMMQLMFCEASGSRDLVAAVDSMSRNAENLQ